jgi:hypothetical protein
MYTRLQPGTRMAWRYDETATAILAGEGVLWPRNPDPARTGVMSRPPGYSLYLAAVYTVLGRSFFAAQLVQNLATSACCVVLVLLTTRLVGFRVGLVAGLVAALSPHLAYTSNFVLPESLSALPMLLGFLVLARVHPDRPGHWGWSAAAGVLFGLTAWLRPNALLLPPFVALLLLLLSRARRRALGHSLAMVAAAALVIAPITVRNYLLSGEVVPISINGGLTLWHGVTEAGGFSAGARRRDKLVMDEEATRYGNPRYREWWAEPDGVARDRDRFRRSVDVIREHPVRFLRVMVRRMGEMLDYSGGGPERLAPLQPPPGQGRPASEEAAEDDPEDVRSHDLARRATDERFLAPGKRLAFLRPLLRPLQGALLRVLTPLVVLGLVALAFMAWRESLLLLALPLYFLVTYSPFLYEWRVAVPMHYGLFAAAAVALVLLGSALAEGVGRLRARRPDQNQAG